MAEALEDGIGDILSKAQKGLGWNTETLAERTGLDESAIRNVRRGEYDAAAVAALGKAFGLNVEALLAIGEGRWQPEELGEFEGFLRVQTPFHEWSVNSFLVWDPQTRRAIAFDTGTSETAMVDALKERGLSLAAVFLTHEHWDHIDALPALLAGGEVPVFISARESSVPEGVQRIEEGFEYRCDSLTVTVIETPGHTAGGMTLCVSGLERPVALVGDALFAGSTGGPNDSYAAALASVKRILELDEQTVLGTGHGPVTTVGEERQMNCFYTG